jgi:phospholipid/cholesterol/gamma-HCH transport system permease protein
VAEDNKAYIEVKETDHNKVVISFSGQLDLHTTAELWRSAIELQKRYTPKLLTIDVKNVDYCNGAGIGLLLELKRLQLASNKKCDIQGMSTELQNLMAMITEQPHKPAKYAEVQPSVTLTIGKFVVGVLNNIRENIILIGMLSVHLLQTLLHPKSVRWQDFMKTMEDIGPNALPLIVLIGFLVGLITAFQAAIPLGRFGAQIYIADLVGLTLVKEMAPLMTAVLLAGRTASAYAAEIGSMKINQEIDALTTMGLDPVKFLTIPRILAATIMTPILSLFLLFFGLVGCGVVMQSLGYNYDIYIHQLESAIQLKDFLGGFIKTFVFGIVIAGIGCLHGLKTRFGASAVGYSTTQAVVSSIIMIVIIDGIFACVYYVLGI